ncbi:MAG: DUF4493 domain-containing protein [Clostridiales bacterium]|jgi:hypothetical protein|nr:DUF4493 domain-containing protein [Clostridiales bacterium]
MSVNEYEQRNKSRIHTRPILSLLIGLTFFTVILLITLAEAGKNVKSGAKPTITNPNNQEDNQGDLNNRKEISTVAIVLETDKTDRRIRLYDIDKNEEINLYYTGGTGILDKYGQAISINQVDMGRIVDISYQNQTNRLTRLQFSQRAWEYIGVNNMTIIPEEKTIKIAKNNYTYTEPFVVDIDRFISLEDLAEQDELTVRGIDEVIWSIIVTKGHGTVKIKDSDAFLGGSITVGYEAVTQITKDMVITVREGNYNLTVENGEYSGTKNITVERNKETVVSIGDLGPEPIKYGKTTFDITPFGADLYIDNELTNYASPVELAYGEHHIQVSLGGYSTYSGNLLVDYASKKIKIVLPELQSREPVSIVELDEQLYEDDTDSDYMEYNDWDNEQYDDNNPEYIDSLINEADYEEDPIVDSERLIYIQKPVGASVYLNGEFKGVSPGSFQKVIGSHVLTFIKKGYQTKSYTIDIADDGLDTYISLPDLIPEY